MIDDTSHLGHIVGFTQMQHGTREDYELLERHEQDYLRDAPRPYHAARSRPCRAGSEGIPSHVWNIPCKRQRRAQRDGADDELIVAALIHDIGDDLAPFNHAEIAASILRPFVRPEVTWIVQQHGLFQSYYYAHHLGGDRHGRDRHREHRWYQACEDFCAQWDQNSFDPSYAASRSNPSSPWCARFSRARRGIPATSGSSSP